MNFFSETLRRLIYLQPSLPQTVQIEVTNECNLNCAMCSRIDLKVPLKSMDFSVYQKIINKLSGVEEVILTGWGEPLFHKDIVKMIKYAKSKGLKVRLTTNGTFLVDRLGEQLLSLGIDAITFSVDEVEKSQDGLGHPLTKQLDNLENFTKKRKDKKPVVTLQSTFHQGKEKNILEIIEFASRIGADRVNVMRLDTRFKNLPRPSVKEEKRFLKIAEQSGHKLGIQVDFLPHVALKGVARNFYKLLAPFLYRFNRYCPRTFGYLYVNVLGQATPCCSLPKLEVGDILKSDLVEIWQGENLKNFWEKQRKICGRCDVLKVKQYS